MFKPFVALPAGLREGGDKALPNHHPSQEPSGGELDRKVGPHPGPLCKPRACNYQPTNATATVSHDCFYGCNPLGASKILKDPTTVVSRTGKVTVRNPKVLPLNFVFV